MVAVVCGSGGFAHRGAVVHGGAEGVAADAVLTGTEAGAGHCGCGGFADRAACSLQAAGRHRIGAHQRGWQLTGVVRQVHVYGCCRNDTRWVWDPCIYKITQCVRDVVVPLGSKKESAEAYHCLAHCSIG